MGNFPLFHIMLFILGFLLFFSGLILFRRKLAFISSERLAKVLSRMTTTPLRGAMFGALITAAVQSSSAVTVMTIVLVDAGVLAFPQAVGIILGTNVGTCVTVQLLGLNLQNLIIPCILVGSLMFALGKKHYGEALIGFACTFLGLSLITYASSPLVYSPAFFSAVSAAKENPLPAILLGTVSTAVIQYSSVVMGVLIALSKHHTIGIETAVPLILGINLGTCFTGLLAGFGSKRSAQQVALAHILLNLLGILAVLPFLEGFVALVRFSASSPAIQIANAHSIFNILSSLAVLPFAGVFTNLVKTLLPDKPQSRFS